MNRTLRTRLAALTVAATTLLLAVPSETHAGQVNPWCSETGSVTIAGKPVIGASRPKVAYRVSVCAFNDGGGNFAIGSAPTMRTSGVKKVADASAIFSAAIADPAYPDTALRVESGPWSLKKGTKTIVSGNFDGSVIQYIVPTLVPADTGSYKQGWRNGPNWAVIPNLSREVHLQGLVLPALHQERRGCEEEDLCHVAVRFPVG